MHYTILAILLLTSLTGAAISSVYAITYGIRAMRGN